MSTDIIGSAFNYIFNLLFQVNHQIAWRFIFSAVLISPFILLIIATRGRLSPSLRSILLGACFWGLFLPFHRCALYYSVDLFLFIRHTAQTGPRIPNVHGNDVPFDIFEIISVIWLLGFLLHFAARSFDYRKTVSMFREGKTQICASYFYRFRSRIYFPPDFELTYTPDEQEMLLAHERQHIAQHDPFLYRVLALVECACWFNPLITIAVRHFQHERELLCDERVTWRFPKHDYGMLILKAAKKKTAARAAAAGIVMEHGSISERVNAMIDPAKTAGKWTAAVLIFFTMLQLVTGFMGFQPAYRTLSEYSPAIINDEFKLKELCVYVNENLDIPATSNPSMLEQDKLIEGIQGYLIAAKEGLTVDEKGLYRYALSHGLTEESVVKIVHISSLRLEMGGVTAILEELDFQIRDLKTMEMDKDYTDDWYLYEYLTDIFL